jgi:hypothetical protein
MTFLASGPVTAAEPRVGESDGGARPDDEPEGSELRKRQRQELHRCEDEPAEPRDRRRLGVHESRV